MADWFLSYSGTDREAIRTIDAALRSHGIATFFDRRSLTPGRPWFDELETALRDAAGVVVFLGPAGLGSIQRRELWLALARQAGEEAAGRDFRVVPVLLPGCDVRHLPGFLALNTWVDLRGADAAELASALGAARTPAIAAPVRLCPFRALSAFREEDAPLYFGRERESDRLLEMVRTNRFVAVVGPSGSGKSSVAQAGLLPRLRLERPPRPAWDAIVFTPGKRPFYHLAAGLARLWLGPEARPSDLVPEAEKVESRLLAGEGRLASFVHEAAKHLQHADRLLILVDQFEELFTQVAEEEVRRLFIDSLLEAKDDAPCHALITLRADYYGRALSLSRPLAELLEGAQLNVGPMEPAGLRQVIVEPARRAGLCFQEGLVERILTDLEKQPGSLPLLEFALTELWNLAGDGLLKHEDYTQIGGVAGAISTRAEQVLAQLAGPQQQKAPAMLTRLVRVSSSEDEGANSREIVRLAELDPTDLAILERFAEARLVVLDREEEGEATVQVAHEALIRGWSTLRKWIEDDAQFLLWRQRLAVFVAEWERTGRDPSALLGGALLAEARRRLSGHPQLLSRTEREFISRSLRRQRGARRWRAAAVVLAVALAGAAGGLSLWLRSDAYQVRSTLANAPLREALSSSRSDDDPYVETILEWIRVWKRTGQAPRTLRESEPWFDRSYMRECWQAALAPENGIGELAAYSNADTPACLARLDLPLSLRETVRQHLHRTYAEVTGDDFTAYRERTKAVQGLVLLHDPQAGALASQTLEAVRRMDNHDQRGQLAFQLLRDAIQVLPERDVQRLLDTFPQPERYYYPERIRTLLLRHRLRLADATELRRQLVHFEENVFSSTGAAAAGWVLARLVELGQPDLALQELERICREAQRKFSGNPIPVAPALPAAVAEALAARGQFAAASRLCDQALASANQENSEEQRSRALAQIARVLARCGRLYDAKQQADRCSRSLDRLRAYAAIVDAGAPR